MPRGKIKNDTKGLPKLSSREGGDGITFQGHIFTVKRCKWSQTTKVQGIVDTNKRELKAMTIKETRCRVCKRNRVPHRMGECGCKCPEPTENRGCCKRRSQKT